MNHDQLAERVHAFAMQRRWETTGRIFATASNLTAAYPEQAIADRFERNTLGLFRLRMTITSYNTCVAVVASRSDWAGEVDTPELWISTEKHSPTTSRQVSALAAPWRGPGATYWTPVVGAHRGARVPTEHRASLTWAKDRFESAQTRARELINKRCSASTRQWALRGLAEGEYYRDAYVIPSARLGYDLRATSMPVRDAATATKALLRTAADDPELLGESKALITAAASLPTVQRLAAATFTPR